ncbi:5S rRNA binding protein [Fragilaria crotonensis]|nr:5S rRNA binding protein [Fragilaria crotonensis]
MTMSRLLRNGALIRRTHKRFFSTDPLVEPWKFVQGLSAEDVAKNETIAAFLRANFKAEEDLSPAGRVDDAVKAVANEAVEKMMQAILISEKSVVSGDIPLKKRDHDVAETFATTLKSLVFSMERELDLYHRSFESRVYDLTVFEDETDTEGTVHRVVPTNVQRHPIQNKLFCVNYLRYHALRPIQIPIVYVNEEESPAMKRGGFIAPVKRYVSCTVEEGVPIPERLELECTGLQLRDVVRLDRVVFPEGVRMSKRVKPERFVIGTVFGRRADQADDA